MANNKNKNDFLQRTLENAADPISIFQSSADLTREIIDDLKDTAETMEMKRDINLLIGAINMPIMHNLVNINIQMCKKYPAVFDVSCGRLVRVTKESLESTSLETNVYSLGIIVNCIRALLISDKAGRITFDVLKTTASHFADAAVTTLLEGASANRESQTAKERFER